MQMIFHIILLPKAYVQNCNLLYFINENYACPIGVSVKFIKSHF